RRRTGFAAVRGSLAAVATSRLGGAGAQAEPPNLLRRPLPRPLGRRLGVVLVRLGVVRRVELPVVEQLETVLTQDRAHLAQRRVELPPGPVPLLPVDPIEALLRHQEPVGRRAVLGDAEVPQRRTAEEDELSAGPQQARRLGDPECGIAPDRGAILRDDYVER